MVAGSFLKRGTHEDPSAHTVLSGSKSALLIKREGTRVHHLQLNETTLGTRSESYLQLVLLSVDDHRCNLLIHEDENGAEQSRNGSY